MKVNKNNVISFLVGLVIGVAVCVITYSTKMSKDQEINKLKTEIYFLKNGVKIDSLKIEK